MYRPFALVIAATALISAVNAMTLKPTQAALWLRPVKPPGQRNLFFRAFANNFYQGAEDRYTRFIGWTVRHSRIMGGLAVVLVALAIFTLSRVPPTSFLPIEDQGYMLVAVQLPEGAALERTTRSLDTAVVRRSCNRSRVSTRSSRLRACPRSTTMQASPMPA